MTSDHKNIPVCLYDTYPIIVDCGRIQTIPLRGSHILSLSIDPTFGEFEVYNEQSLLGRSVGGTYKFKQPTSDADHRVYDHLVHLGALELGIDRRNLFDLNIRMIQRPDIIHLSENVIINILITKLNVFLIADGISMIRFAPT